MPSRLSWFLQGTAVSAVASTAGFFVWTKHCYFEPMSESTDPIFKSKFHSKFNPNQNPTFHDVCVRRIPLRFVDPDILKDAEHGGPKLVERFSQGVWGGKGFAVQREYLKMKYSDEVRTGHQLWTKAQLQSSSYEPGTEMVDHFVVLEKSPSTILIRCGDSPLHNPDGARPGDGLFEMTAEAKFDEGFAEFRLKSVFFQGEGKAEKAPFDGEWMMPWAHRQYDKLWMEGAVAHCRKPMVDIDWEKVKPGIKK